MRKNTVMISAIIALIAVIGLLIYVCYKQQREIERLRRLNVKSLDVGFDAGQKSVLNQLDSTGIELIEFELN